MNEDTARCCSVLCPDGGSCSLQYSHTGEHYSTQELLLDMQNPDRHEVKRLRKEKAEALAACAEMRAALERMIKYAVEDRATTPGSTRLERQITRANCLLARPDLGAGMVLVEREVLERLRDVLQRLPRAGWGYTDAERAAIADLDALFKKDGG